MVSAHVAVVTLNRPDKRNAVNPAVTEAMVRVIATLEADANVRAVVLTSSEPRVFCAGADLAAVAANQGAGIETKDGGFAGFTDAARLKPWIAAVDGVAVAGDKLFVVERDNHRVQVLSLPGFEPVGTFGENELRSPYGLWINETEPGELEVYVTDSFMYGKHYDVVPPYSELGQRVRRYRVQFDQDGKLMANYGGAFGDTREQYALRMVESIAGDPRNDRMLVADEDTRHLSTLREYTFGGRFTGRSLPQDSFGAQAEGVALWTCPDGSGYWIAVDQLAPLTIFHLFDRATLAPVGSFSGKVTSHTDGVALHGPSARFPGGALYAVHDDKALAAFDLRDVARTLRITPTCVEQ